MWGCVVRWVVPHILKRCSAFAFKDKKMKGTTGVSSHSPIGILSHFRRPKPSATLLWEPQISHKWTLFSDWNGHLSICHVTLMFKTNVIPSISWLEYIRYLYHKINLLHLSQVRFLILPVIFKGNSCVTQHLWNPPCVHFSKSLFCKHLFTCKVSHTETVHLSNIVFSSLLVLAWLTGVMTVAEIAYCYMAIECCLITHTPIFDNALSLFEV